MGLVIKNVNKTFGDKKVLDNVSFKIDRPKALGLVGANGAGKTTIIRIILDIISKDSGSILWNDKDIKDEKLMIGYLPEERGIYQKSTVREQAIYFAKLKGLKADEAEKSLEIWSKKLGIDMYLDVLADKLSKGNQQKVQLLIVFMINPDLIILDEPLSGLDPVNAEIVKNLLKELIAKGKYVIFTSHQMHIVEEFCDDLVMLVSGKIVLEGNINDIKKKYISSVLNISGNGVFDALKDKYEVKKLEDDEIEIMLKDEKMADEVLKELVSKNISVRKFEVKTKNLREIFIEKAGGVL